ncbi:MAG: NAD(P)-dependent oxidoreductase [Sphingobacteriales bacterium]|jgi:nucleoside-diphosphate-sugar epimerase|nr:NAD(P)-dependent oxidoreductase [Sphingobacteriales bacterium]MBP9141216.1 NAD(P)-dependent oxidoreductase [Chitinophagales bacterium]MDA0199083.1 NAD(P)-dependent oxidoreductase [Bacteroidota bacterium]MBK6890439.1 NAD(P)-dependent oxidoreductase [Sphingobacteriales bacterium]MBK7526509.1 NAD(P)-dependent oxidoreductase [Sphingobacteriales bacterium]
MNKKQNVLITGSSGTVGLEVLKQLYNKSENFNLTVFDIKIPKTEKIYSKYKDKIEVVYGDISNFEDVKKISTDKDFVIHLAALIPPAADEHPELAYKINTQGTENLVRNLEVFSPNCFFLYSSSISVYGDRVKTPDITVNDKLQASEGDEYAISKIEAEKIIINSKLNWSIFRLAAIMGNHKISKLMFHMPLDTSLEIATPHDTALAFVNAIEKADLISKKIFNLGGGENYRISYADFLNRSFEISGLGKADFPKFAFASKNFHCGYYQDGEILEKILHFRNGTIDDYFNNMAKQTNKLIYFLTSIFRRSIKNNLLKKSEPYLAYKNKDTKLMNRFFNN